MPSKSKIQACRGSCTPERVQLTDIVVLERRKRSRDRLYYLMVSDEASADAKLEVELSAFSGLLSASDAAAAIRGTTIGSVISVIEGTLRRQPWDGGGFTLCATQVQLSAATETPSILFDINFSTMMTEDEFGALCRQLRLSYTSNRRSSRPFNLLLGGAGIGARSEAKLGAAAIAGHWEQWESVKLIDSASPWEQCTDVTYLCADSPHILHDIKPGSTLVIGGLVDHVPKPGAAFARASSNGVRTARLPLERFFKMTGRTTNGGTDGADVTTLAVVQMLLGMRELGSWEKAIPACPALRCAPLRKYVRWLPPYGALNEAARPAEMFPAAEAVLL